MVQNNHRKLSSRYFPVIHVLNNTNQPKIALDKVSVRNYKCQLTFGDLQAFTIFTETLIFTEKKHNIIKICSKFKWKDHYAKYAKIRVFTDSYISVSGQNHRFCSYTVMHRVSCGYHTMSKSLLTRKL